MEQIQNGHGENTNPKGFGVISPRICYDDYIRNRQLDKNVTSIYQIYTLSCFWEVTKSSFSDAMLWYTLTTF